ncbi:1-phosphatidylinositol 3-phosphate 5-kinase-like isoform X1 [Trichoplusia ni]|uniref:1-phosphatidylinositol 3-phosphate 5-kinase-like isoform X1 n=2 Tax=Trichoplusia ni TaxID=7111 RepID=A0A7E5VZC6_TRINI|nr:1-phosphatidylinositol 3-phosphate 5-kinase-like isoform X1 [Trichoplusia ni]
MILEGCAEPNLGCCILLRGAPLQELIKVKKVARFMVLACYNWKLEKAFLGDIEAILPEPGMTFDDDVNENDVTKEEVTNNFNNSDTQSNQSANDEAKRSDSVQEESRKSNETDSNESSRSDNIFTNANVKTDNDKSDVTVKNDAKIDDTKCNEMIDDYNSKQMLNDDPLQNTKFVRKTDSDKTLSCGVPIRDFSDPLRATLSVDDDVFLPKEEAKLKADTHTDRWCTDDVVLSMSPNMIIPAPFLETEAGRRCGLRAQFPAPLLARAPAPPARAPRAPPAPAAPPHPLKEVHPFVQMAIASPADDPAQKAALAHYRATGGRLVNDKHKHQCPLYKPTVVKKQKEPEVDPNEKPSENEPLDPLAPENHQQLSLLLYSFSNKSANVPDFCVNPWIVTMEMYGRHDISLGAFLEKYCFNGDYKCTSPNCNVPMNQHVRRFVHEDVCITITCNTIGHSNVDKGKEEQSKQVMFWSRCAACGEAGAARRVSGAALALSLAAYVRLRLHAVRYARAHTCPHPLHAHAHAFVHHLTTACFRYSKITPYEIQLPPDMISINYDTKQMRDNLISQLNELVQKGHEIFSGLSDVDAEKDYQSFKQHMEQIHLALTSASLHENNTTAAIVRSLWGVSDRIISGEKMLRDAQDRWSSPPAKTKAQPDNIAEDKSDLEDSSGDDTSKEGAGTTYVFTDSKEPEKEHTGTEEDEEKGDKKTVRQILSQLLSNNQPANQSGIILSSGEVPVVVLAGELGSVIAATLASVTYRRTRSQLRHSTQSDQEEENMNAAGKDKTDGDKSKQAKSNDHVEVLLKDGLVCRVYYASQFQRLRHLLLQPLSADSKCGCYDDAKDRTDKGLCDIEEGFIRSLAHCVPWAARGGKSGSTFCKTKDDRYVLKEMTKPEWQQFLEFAPHYFNYVTTCRQNKQPSLLARILGVFSVGGAGSGVLVLEHVWYGCGGATRFDLKGSSRHRLAPGSSPAVLMDENLLNLRWETPLYVQSHTGAVLWDSIERDSSFLAAHDVMDYSLLLGLHGNTLVLGIIDYIRTFTWDKKLEHLVKKNLGSGQPTVVSPEQYKRRFCNAARKYFLQCPSHWDHLYNTIHA